MLKLMYITNKPEVASVADQSGVDRIMIDLEKLGKVKRQQGWNSIISDHCPEDIIEVKKVLKKADILARVNPINDDSAEEIDKVISYGADIVMLPYFKTASEVETFLSAVRKRTKTCLLLETKEAVESIDEILSIPGIDEVHIGLNDLSHSYEADFLFQMFPMGTVDYIVGKLKQHNLSEYGIGGIARLNHGLIPAEDVIAEHYRLGSNCAILSRAFCNAEQMDDIHEIERIFSSEVDRIRKLEGEVTQFDDELFEYCRKRFNDKVQMVVDKLCKQEA